MIWSWFWPALRNVVARLASTASAPQLRTAPIPLRRSYSRRPPRRRTLEG